MSLSKLIVDNSKESIGVASEMAQGQDDVQSGRASGAANNGGLGNNNQPKPLI